MIHLLVGNTGAGKSTYANRMKAESNGVIFTIDKWNKILFFPDKTEKDGLDWFLERIERAELLMQNLILQLENAKVDSILDVGLSKFLHREKYRNFAKKHNIEVRIHFLNIPKEIRKERVLKRNVEKGETFDFVVTEKDFEFMETWFETLTEAELLTAIIIKE
ncbi:AAA family ATPase [Polaribacter glomeratus]|uniref:Zeta toxin n=1 Tax=Polaribacter glomeratus TaxID=102 RepID=A0A2S7WXP3_9FLAO|nr:ATP-binding protein [Polaribacter glomeratus]PQJ82191.1 Zeta toxin [Polaribacter glomeratus]TXD66785.1 ATP-binding protein [Polaribacter glomeratus]